MREKSFYKVLIVEDEIHIGQLIKKLVKWDEIGLVCVGTADNGESALRMIQEHSPHIVITDIRMPKINGLDLICMTKEQRDDIRFVVISGYKEFEYAHRALQYGVNDYLLKPIDEKELNQVLIKLSDGLQQEEGAAQEKRQMKKVVSESQYIIRQNLLKQLIEKEKTPTVEEVNENYHLSMTGEIYRGIDIKLDYWDCEKQDEKQDRITVDKIISIVEKNLDGNVSEQLLCEKENLHIYGLFNYRESAAGKIKTVIGQILTDIQEYLIRLEQYDVTIGIGQEVDSLGQIRHSIAQAYQAVQNRIVLGTGRLIYVEMVSGGSILEPQKYLMTYREGFVAATESYSRSMLEKSIQQIYSGLRFREDMDYSVYYYITDHVLELFFDSLDIENKEGEQLKYFLKNRIQHCYTTAKLKDMLGKYLGEYLEVCLKTAETESARPIRDAKLYIEKHYQEKIILEDLAAIVHLNPVYFSVLFKKLPVYYKV